MACKIRPLLFGALTLYTAPTISHEIILNGSQLTIEQVFQSAYHPITVRIDPAAQERVEKSHKLLLQAAKEDHPIYGLNRGVGLNKDKTIFQGDTLSEEARAASEEFNRNMLYSHSAAFAPELSKKIVFPILLIRLNMMLKGHTGVSPEVAQMFLEFINHRIQPIIPGQGSVGEGDITILSHIGLAMMGLGEVIYQEEKMPAAEALKRAQLKPIKPFAKDALSILSSNAYSVAMASLIVQDMKDWLKKSISVMALSMEGLNANIAPFLAMAQQLRPFAGQREVARLILETLKGSSLFERSSTRALQDPLSYRTISQLYGSIFELINRLEEKLTMHLNSSDDNPGIVVDARKPADASAQEADYYVKEGGAVVPTANFEPVNLVIDFESLAIALSHASHSIVQRLMRLSDERFTHLTRFLSPHESTLAFASLQKTFMSLDAEIKSLSLPISTDFFPVAGEIEDSATNAPLVMHRLCKIITNLYHLLGLELMYAAQAADLRKALMPDFRLADATAMLHQSYRQHVAFLDKDRPLTPDMKESTEFVIQFLR